MLEMKNKLLISETILAALLFVSCTVKVIQDPIDPRLPMYTENASGLAGALVNDKVWSSALGIGWLATPRTPLIIAYGSRDNLFLRFDGYILDDSLDYIEFYLKDINVIKIEDLMQLNNKKIVLDGIENVAVIHEYSLSDFHFGQDAGGIGQLYIKKVQLNKLHTSAIISGTFGFTFQHPSRGFLEVSYGRFDYKFTEESNFYNDWNEMKNPKFSADKIHSNQKK